MSTINIEGVKTANTLAARGLGVIGWRSFGKLNGLLLTNTNSVHTFFVRFPLDIVFFDKERRVIKLVKNLKPYRISPIVWGGKDVLEMPTGSIEKYSIRLNDIIDF